MAQNQSDINQLTASVKILLDKIRNNPSFDSIEELKNLRPAIEQAGLYDLLKSADEVILKAGNEITAKTASVISFQKDSESAQDYDKLTAYINQSWNKKENQQLREDIESLKKDQLDEKSEQRLLNNLKDEELQADNKFIAIEMRKKIKHLGQLQQEGNINKQEIEQLTKLEERYLHYAESAILKEQYEQGKSAGHSDKQILEDIKYRFKNDITFKSENIDKRIDHMINQEAPLSTKDKKNTTASKNNIYDQVKNNQPAQYPNQIKEQKLNYPKSSLLMDLMKNFIEYKLNQEDPKNLLDQKKIIEQPSTSKEKLKLDLKKNQQGSNLPDETKDYQQPAELNNKQIANKNNDILNTKLSKGKIAKEDIKALNDCIEKLVEKGLKTAEDKMNTISYNLRLKGNKNREI